MLFDVPGGILPRDGQRSSRCPASFEDEIADGFLVFAPASSHHLHFLITSLTYKVKPFQVFAIVNSGLRR
jgi:hypothetical protein